MGLQAAMVVAMVAASCDGVAMANAEARRLASSDVTQAILPPESRACRAVPRGAALVVAQPVSGWLRETWAREDTARGSDFLSDTPLRAGPPASMISRGGLLFFSEERTRETFSFASIEGLRRGRRGGCVGGARRGEGRGVCHRAGWNSGAVGKERVGGGL